MCLALFFVIFFLRKYIIKIHHGQEQLLERGGGSFIQDRIHKDMFEAKHAMQAIPYRLPESA
jgi:hypothetical protein